MKARENLIYILCSVSAILFGLLGFCLGRVFPYDTLTKADTSNLSSAKDIESTALSKEESLNSEEKFEKESEASEKPLGALQYEALEGSIEQEEGSQPQWHEGQQVLLPPNAADNGIAASSLQDETMDIAGVYVLKRIETGLSVFRQGVALAHLEIPGAIDSETMDELDEGIRFETMEDIETWLESFDS